MTEEQEVAAIPLVEERLSVEKREVETGRYRISVRVEERQDTIPAELSHDEVEIERIPMNQTLSQLPSVRLEGSTTVIPVVEEVVVVEKKLVLVEEIHVRRKTNVKTEQIPVTIRSEHADIDRSGFADGNGVDYGDHRNRNDGSVEA
jgi:uncharacterized protein (TIGR02271 family)